MKNIYILKIEENELFFGIVLLLLNLKIVTFFELDF